MPMSAERILATYLIETAQPLERAAAVLAGEQSTGTFVRVPGESDALRERFGARVERITDLGEVPGPALPGAHSPRHGAGYRRAELAVSWPLENLGPSLPTLLATVMGNLFELREFSALRLLDLDLPPTFARAYPGPRFGIEGTRALAGVRGRPLIGTIIKPSVGLSPEETADLVRTLALAGLDFIKDDELMADPPHSPLARRVAAVTRAIEEAADRTGRRVVYAFNITGDIDDLRRNHDTVLEGGGTCVMVCINSIGLAGVAHLRRFAQLPIHGHRNGWGMLTRCPALGMEFRAYQKLCRLAGVDHLHTNGLRNKFFESDESVVRSVRDCLDPLFGGYRAMPVLSSGQWAGQAPDTHARTGTVDLLYLCGGGIMAHPQGVPAGVRSVRQAWEAALAGVPLAEYAQDRPELRAALETFGP